MSTQQDAVSGKYMAGLNRVCRCGRQLAEHLAAKPYALEDTNCAGFKRDRTKEPPAEQK